MLSMLELLRTQPRSDHDSTPSRPPFAALVFATLAAQPALAQSLKPGLWEITSNINVNNNPATLQQFAQTMKKHIASLPPAERKVMEEEMASQHQRISDKGMSVEFCLTPEMAARPQALSRQFEHCNVKQSPMVGSTVHFSFSCDDARSSGDGSVTFSGATGFTQQVRSVSHDQNGPAGVPMTVASTGRWLGADCGSVKPPLPGEK